MEAAGGALAKAAASITEKIEAKLAAWQAVRSATRIDEGTEDRLPRSTLRTPTATALAAEHTPLVRPTQVVPATRAA